MLVAWLGATCGFENYGEFAAGVNAITKIFESRLATAKLNITSHRDDILVKVMDGQPPLQC